MFRSSLFLILLWLPMVASLDYYLLNGYSTAALYDITSLAINRNGTVFVSAFGPQFFIYTNDTPNTYLKRLEISAPAIINSIDLTHDGQSIALGLNNYQLKVYKYNQTLNIISLNQTLTESSDEINSVYFSYDKSLLLTGSKDSKARLYALINGQYVISRIFTQPSVITTVLISSDNQYIYVADVAGTMKIYKNSSVGYSLFQTLVHSTTAQITSAALSNDSLTLAISDMDGEIKVYKLNIHSEVLVSYVFLQKLDEAVIPLKSVSMNSDASILISSDNIKTIRIYTQSALGYYTLKYTNLTGLHTKITANSSIILGSNDRVTLAYKTCAGIPNCYQCSSGTTCTVCNPTYYANAGVCDSCSANCSNCLGSSTSCTSCVDGYFPNSGNICQSCSLGCKLCTGVAACTICFKGFYRSGAICVPCLSNCSSCQNGIACVECSTTHYESYGSCLPCASPCNKCANLTTCYGCIATNYLSSPNTCTLCLPPCVTCTSKNSCTSCTSGYFYTGVSCQVCPDHCLTCTDETTCTSCKPSHLNTFFDGSICHVCPYNCSTCTSATTCMTCTDGFYLTAGSCPKCSPHCVTCSSASVCTQCSSEYTLSSSTCIRCPANCTNCSTATQCTGCKKGFYLESSSCLTCSMEGCIYCSSLNTCLLCESGYSLVNSTCVNFESLQDPYGYIKEITLTSNQTLSLIITIILLILIIGGGFAVYCWIVRDLDDSNKEEVTPVEGNARKGGSNPTGFEASQVHLSSSLHIP